MNLFYCWDVAVNTSFLIHLNCFIIYLFFIHTDLINEMRTTIKSSEYYRKRDKKQTSEEKDKQRNRRKEQQKNSTQKKILPRLETKGLVFDYFLKETDNNRNENNTSNANYDNNDNSNNNNSADDEIIQVKTYENHF